MEKKDIVGRIKRGYDENIAWEYHRYSKGCLEKFVRFVRDMALNQDFHLVIRPHPSVSVDQYRSFFLSCGVTLDGLKNVTVTKSLTIKEWIAVSDVVGSSWSTSVWDAVKVGKPGFLFTPERRPDWLETFWNSAVPNIENCADFYKLKLENVRRNERFNIIDEMVSWLIDVNDATADIWSRGRRIYFFRHMLYQLRSFFRTLSMRFFCGVGVPKGMQRDFFFPIKMIPVSSVKQKTLQ